VPDVHAVPEKPVVFEYLAEQQAQPEHQETDHSEHDEGRTGSVHLGATPPTNANCALDGVTLTPSRNVARSAGLSTVGRP
jgi:hypothetical protein